MIYAIRAVGTGFIKFGYSHSLNLVRRLEGLQTGCPYQLEIVASSDGDKARERQIHNFLIQAGDHIRGEWFKEGHAAQTVLNHMQVGLRGLLNTTSSNVLDLRLANRHRRLGAALELSKKLANG